MASVPRGNRRGSLGVSSRKNRKQREAIERAIVEALEGRRLLTAAPTVFAPRTGEVDITWASTGAESYKVQRSDDNGASFTDVSVGGVDTFDATTTTIADISALPETAYQYRIVTLGSGGGETSDPAGITTLAAPTDLLPMAVWSDGVDLVWNDNSSHEGNYAVECSTDPTFASPQVTIIPANSQAQDMFGQGGLTSGTEYYFRVRAVNGGGYSSYSNVVSVTPGSSIPTGNSGEISGSFSGSEPYSYTVTGGSVSGLATYSGTYDIIWNYSDTAGSYAVDVQCDISYAGNGGFSTTASDGSPLSGTIIESGTLGWAYHIGLTWTLNGDGTWGRGGSASGSSYDNGDWSAAITGSYADSGDGWSLSGSIGGSDAEHNETTSTWSSALGADGQWQSISASIHDISSSDVRGSSSGSGSYSGSGTSGTLTQSGSDRLQSSADAIATLDSSGAWAYSGAVSGSYHGGGSLAYAGSGSYLYADGDASVSGTISEGGSTGDSTDASWTAIPPLPRSS